MAQQEFTDAIALLKADHREVEELFAKFESASGDGKKRQIAEQICTELKIHTSIEEEIFYPALEGKIEEDLLSEEIEHHVKEEEAPSEGMFSQARKTDVDLVALRDQMMARKQELKQQAETSGLPPAQPMAVNPQPA